MTLSTLAFRTLAFRTPALRPVALAPFVGLALLLAPPVPAAAQVAPSAPAILSIGSLDGPAIERLATSIARRATADAASPLDQRLQALKSALDDLGIIEAVARRPASADPRTDAVTEAGKRALLQLTAGGHSREALSRATIVVEAEWLAAAPRSKAEETTAFVHLDRLSSDITDAGARVEALITIGRTHQALGHKDRVTRYGQLAERATRDMEKGPARDALLATVLALSAADQPSRTLGLAVAVLGGFEDAAARARAIATVAAAAAPLETGSDLRSKVWPVLASGDAGAVEALRREATLHQEDEVAVLLAASALDAATQDAALSEVVLAQIAQRRAFAALDSSRLMLTDERARHEAMIARSLADAGYDTIANAILTGIEQHSDLAPAVRGALQETRALIAEPALKPRTAEEHAAAIRAIPGDEQEKELAAAAITRIADHELHHTLRAVRDLKDYRVRVAAFRAISMLQADKLDTDDRLESRAVPASGTAQASDATGPVILQTAGLKVTDGDAVRQTTPTLVHTVPDLTATADTVRAMVPVPLPGVSELSLAGLNRFTQLNRFNSKFLEDVVGTTAREHIFKTQGTINPTFIYLTNGVFTARDLLHSIDTSNGSQLVRSNGVYTLRVPLVIGPDATLILSGQDAAEIRVSASAGAFLINAGKLFVVDTRLIGWNEERQAPAYADYEHKHEFRPFLTTWSGSETYIAGSDIVALGYSAGKSYGITLSSGPREGNRPDTLRRPLGLFVDSTFDNLLYGFYTYEADDVVVIGNEYRNSIVYGLDPHDRSKRLVMAYNTLYGTLKKHGAIFSRDVEHSHLIGNIAFENAGSGIMMDRRSSLNWIYANTAIANVQDGMTVYESPCILVANNAFVHNGRSGMKIRNSWSVLVDDNHVAMNAGPGIEAYVSDLTEAEGSEHRDFEEDPFLKIASFTARGNTVSRNATGIAGKGVSEVSLSGNIFVDQTPGNFDGDLKPLRAHLLQYAGGEDAVTLRPTDLVPTPKEAAEHAGVGFCPPPASLPGHLSKEGM